MFTELINAPHGTNNVGYNVHKFISLCDFPIFTKCPNLHHQIAHIVAKCCRLWNYFNQSQMIVFVLKDSREPHCIGKDGPICLWLWAEGR